MSSLIPIDSEEEPVVLIIDDNPTNLSILVDSLTDFGFETLVARDGETGLNRARLANPDIILLDVMMPGIDGFETCQRLKDELITQDIPVIFMTALSDPADKVRGFEVGGVDYITKPLHQTEVLARVNTHIRIRRQSEQLESQNKRLKELTERMLRFNQQLEKKVQERTLELQQAYDETIFSLALAMELRDQETEGHCQRVAEATVLLARKLNLSEAELVQIRRGALLHDIGKIGIPDSILLKHGPLTAEERATMQQHPQYAYEMLKQVDFLRPALDIPRYHHEWWDGTGYCEGLKGEAIPLAARIFAVVDVWDALSFERRYRKAWSPQQVYTHIEERAGTHFDPHITSVFLDLLKQNKLILNQYLINNNNTI